MTADNVQADLDAARDELHEAQRIAALLDEPAPVRRHPIAVGVARDVIERDLAARRVEAWTSIVDRLRSEGQRRGIFA